MPGENLYTPYYSLSPNSITLFELPEGLRYCGRSSEGFNNLLENSNKYGELSEHARKRLRNTIRYMLYITGSKDIRGKEVISKSVADTIDIERGNVHAAAVPYKLTFITLTLPSPQRHSDTYIKAHALNQLLIEARAQWHVDFFVWKAEKQENGNIHFHILTNRYIHHVQLRDTWNRIINKAPMHYVDMYSRKMRDFFNGRFRMLPNDTRSEDAQRKAYAANLANGWTQPNSTDIHALYKVRNVEAYICKYLAKGVTKTARTRNIDNLRDKIEKIDASIGRIRELQPTWEDKVRFISEKEAKIAVLEREREVYDTHLTELVDKGVKGKIWGCSQSLSRCHNLVNASSFPYIPEFDKVDKIATYRAVTTMGNRAINTLVFDIKETPVLNSMLSEHICRSALGYPM
jgi:hypothetical protein